MTWGSWLLLPSEGNYGGVTASLSMGGHRQKGGMDGTGIPVERWPVTQIGMPSKSLYRANVLLGLLDTFQFGQVRDWSSLSNCFFILDLWGNGDMKAQLHLRSSHLLCLVN